MLCAVCAEFEFRVTQADPELVGTALVAALMAALPSHIGAYVKHPQSMSPAESGELCVSISGLTLPGGALPCLQTTGGANGATATSFFVLDEVGAR